MASPATSRAAARAGGSAGAAGGPGGRALVGPLGYSFLLLPTAIEVARGTGRGPELPTAFADALMNLDEYWIDPITHGEAE